MINRFILLFPKSKHKRKTPLSSSRQGTEGKRFEEIIEMGTHTKAVAMATVFVYMVLE